MKISILTILCKQFKYPCLVEFGVSKEGLLGVFVISLVPEGTIGQLQLGALSALWANNRGHPMPTYFSLLSANFSIGITYLAQ